MTSADTPIRSVPPILAGFVAIVCFGSGSAVGTLADWAVGGPTWLSAALYVAGAALGFLLGRTVLRMLYTPR